MQFSDIREVFGYEPVSEPNIQLAPQWILKYVIETEKRH